MEMGGLRDPQAGSVAGRQARHGAWARLPRQAPGRLRRD
jgi:hypothetical protein